MKTKIRVLILKGIDESYYSIFVYFDLFEFLFLVNRKPRKKYPPSILRKIATQTNKTSTYLREYDLEKRINLLKLSSFNNDTIYYEQEL